MSDLSEGLDNYNRCYLEGANVKSYYYVINPTETDQYDLYVVLEQTTVMEDFCKARIEGLSNLLTFQEILYFFWRTASWLKHLKDNKVYYGSLQRKNMRVCADGKYKLSLYPVMRNSYELAAVRLSNRMTINTDADEPFDNVDGKPKSDNGRDLDREYFFSPELIAILERDSASIKGFTFMNWELNDIYVLGMWTLYFQDKKVIKRTVNLDKFYIDYKAIYNEVKNLGIMINNKFADLLRGCLMGNLNERLNIDQIDEIVGHTTGDKANGIVQRGEAIKQVLDRAELAIFDQEHCNDKKYYYNKEVIGGIVGDVSGDRHLYTWAHSPSKGNTFGNNQKPDNSPNKIIDFGVNITNLNDSVISNSPFKSGPDKVYRPNTLTLNHLKKTMFHVLENDLLPKLPYYSITGITISEKQFILREYKKGIHIGFILYRNEDIYFGEVSNYKRHGKGIFSNAKHEVFYGDFHDDLLHGEGRYYYENGNICLGNWSKGYFNGDVVIYNRAKNQEYVCNYRLGTVQSNRRKTDDDEKEVVERCGSLEWFMREGYNQNNIIQKLVEFITGRHTQGADSWDLEGKKQSTHELDLEEQQRKSHRLEDQKNADEELQRELLSRYEFIQEVENPNVDNEMEHDFDARNLNDYGNYWVSYRGSTLDGKKQGVGELTFMNGERFRGEFDDGVPNGKGVFYYKCGEVIAGIWRRGILIESI